MVHKGMPSKGKVTGKYSPPDIHAQAEEGALNHPKDSDEGFGVMSAQAADWADTHQPDRYALVLITETGTRMLASCTHPAITLILTFWCCF